MTALRPERGAPRGDEDLSSYDYETTGEYAAAVDRLADPLNDPLPGRGMPSPGMPTPGAPVGGTSGEVSTAAWFRPQGPGAEPSVPTGTTTAGAGYGDGSYGTYEAYGAGAGYGGGAGQGGAAGYGVAQDWQAAPAQVPAAPQTPASGPYGYPQQPYGPHEAQAAGASAWAAQAPPAAVPAQPVPQPTPDAPRPGRAARRRQAEGGDTAVMPVVEPGGDTPGEPGERTSEEPSSAQPGRAARRRAAAAAAPVEPPATDADPGDGVGGPGAPGGRAARRRAAQQAARRGGRSGGRANNGAATAGNAATDAGTPAGTVADTATAPGSSGAPKSRLEARRAARAAKDSPAVLASRLIGEAFITLGVLMLLFVTYQLWWSNVLAHQEAGGATKSLQKQWDGGKNGGAEAGTFSPGQGFAIIYIPKLDVKAPIAEGTDKHKVLDKGMVGHYSGAQETAMPWAKTGNFALAAHRNTHGEPFRYINRLVKGDKVVVETESTYYTYEVTSMLPQTPPSNVSVIQPIPTGSGFTKPGRYITLTTCTPEFTSTYRLIVWGKMVAEQPRSKGTPAALLG